MGWRNLPTLRVGWRKYRNLFLFLINTLLLYPLSLPLHTDRLTDGQTDGGSPVWRVRHHYYDWKKKIQSSVWRVRDHYYDRKKIMF